MHKDTQRRQPCLGSERRLRQEHPSDLIISGLYRSSHQQQLGCLRFGDDSQLGVNMSERIYLEPREKGSELGRHVNSRVVSMIEAPYHSWREDFWKEACPPS